MGTPGFFTDKFNDENKDLFSFISLIYFFKFYIEYNEYLKEKDLFKLRKIMKEKVNIEKILQMKKDEFFSLTYKRKINYLYKLISGI